MTRISELKILVCDDSVTNVTLLQLLLETDGYSAITVLTDPTEVEPTLKKDQFDLLILDLAMPVMSGFDVMERIKASAELSQNQTPILVLTAQGGREVRNQALDMGAQDFVTKPFDSAEILLRVRNLLRVRASYLAQLNLNKELERKVEERTRDLNQATDLLIERMAWAAEMRDRDTGKHVMRVGKIARLLAERLGLPESIAFMIEKAAPLHDLGKIGIPDSVLLKKSGLNEREREIMNLHTQMGADLLAQHESMLVKMAASIALTHHERWDGKGYPQGLKGDVIPIEGRITALSDVFDALTTQRPYKEPWSIDRAVDFIKDNSATQFDPALVDLFVQNLDQVLEIKASYEA